MNPVPCCLQTGADHCLRRPLAIGARDMDHGRQGVLRIAQSIQQPPHPVKGQINDLGVQRHHARQHSIRCLLRHFAGVLALSSDANAWGTSPPSVGAGRSPRTAGGSLSSIRVMLINSSRIWGRGVTRSNMP